MSTALTLARVTLPLLAGSIELEEPSRGCPTSLAVIAIVLFTFTGSEVWKLAPRSCIGDGRKQRWMLKVVH